MSNITFKNRLHNKRIFHESGAGFTLMEIVVATTIFVMTITLMLTLFNYTLKISRQAEALRQLTQGMRNFSEFLVKEIRNGKIDYSTVIAGCSDDYKTALGYTTFLGLINVNGERECLTWIASGGGTMYLEKEGLLSQQINPTNFKVVSARFYVRPTCAPDTACYASVYPAVQPFVTMALEFKLTLPTGEVKIIPYQTTVSTDQYDTPRN